MKMKPLEIKNNATSIKTIIGYEVQREILLANILNSIDKLLIQKNEKEIIDDWITYCAHIEKKININYKNNIIKATFKTINNNGQAILQYNKKKIIFDGAILNI